MWACVSGNNIGEEGAKALAPHLGKLVNMNKLGLGGKIILGMRLCDARRWWYSDGCFLWACVSDNNIGEEGANALAPHMGKLVNMNTLHLNSKRVLVMRVWCKLLVVFMVMGGVCVREQHW